MKGSRRLPIGKDILAQQEEAVIAKQINEGQFAGLSRRKVGRWSRSRIRPEDVQIAAAAGGPVTIIQPVAAGGPVTIIPQGVSTTAAPSSGLPGWAIVLLAIVVIVVICEICGIAICRWLDRQSWG